MDRIQSIKAFLTHGARIRAVEEIRQSVTSVDERYLPFTDAKKASRYFSAHEQRKYVVECDHGITALHVVDREAFLRLREFKRQNHLNLNTWVSRVFVNGSVELFYWFRTQYPIQQPSRLLLEGVTLLGEGSAVAGPYCSMKSFRFKFAPKFSPENQELIELPEAILALASPPTLPANSTSDKIAEPVNGAKLRQALYKAGRNHVVITEDEAVATTLWIIHTYTLDCFDITPRLAIKSPTKQCGKTTLLELLSLLVHAPVLASNVTGPSLFRLLKEKQVTILADEADTYLPRNDELRGIINSGHKRTGKVLRVFEDRTAKYPTYGAVAVACIDALPDTIEDRSVGILLKRKLPTEHIDRITIQTQQQYEQLKRKLMRWTQDHSEILKSADPKMPSELGNRDADNWRPLLAIADALGGPWPKRARRTAVALSKSGYDDRDSTNIALLRDIREVFKSERCAQIPSAELAKELASFEGRPWAEYKHNQPISQNALARLLRGFQIAPFSMRDQKGRVCRGYTLAQFKEHFRRYLWNYIATPQCSTVALAVPGVDRPRNLIVRRTPDGHSELAVTPR